jgi:hypothetical protein
MCCAGKHVNSGPVHTSEKDIVLSPADARISGIFSFISTPRHADSQCPCTACMTLAVSGRV